MEQAERMGEGTDPGGSGVRPPLTDPDGEQDRLFTTFMGWLAGYDGMPTGTISVSVTEHYNFELTRNIVELGDGRKVLSLWMTGNYGDDGETPTLLGLYHEESDYNIDEGGKVETFNYWQMDTALEYYEGCWWQFWTAEGGFKR